MHYTLTRLIFRKFFFLFYRGLIWKNLPHKINNLLDLGCGKGRLIKSVVEIDDFKLSKAYLVGIDIYKPYLEVAKKFYHDVVVGDVRFLPFRMKSFDLIIATELIEHLPKSDAYNLLKNIEVIAKKQLQLITPVGDNQKYHLEDNNPWQAHLSKWSPEEFRYFGFKVYGVNGIRSIYSERSEYKVRCEFLRIFFHLIRLFTQLFVYKIPKIGYQMICIKSVSSFSNCKKKL